jgi:Putative adhesin
MKLSILLLFAIALIFAPAALAQQSDEDFRQQAPFGSGGSVTVENGRGDTRVEGWDKNEILVEAHKYYEGDGSQRAEWLRETKIRFEGDEHRRLIKVEYPENFFGWNHWNGRHGVNLTVHLPRRVDAELKNDRGQLTVQQISGKLEIANDRGNIDVTGLDGELRVHGDRGSLKVRDSAIRNGLRVSLDRGSIDIDLKRLDGESNLEVSRGDLSLTLPGNAAFTLDAERNRRSSFHTDFSVLARGGFNGNEIRGDVNGGGPTLRLRGDRGRISLHAASQ